MMTKSTILVALTIIAVAQAGLLGPAIVAPYASSFNAHHINHAIAHPLLAPAPVPVPLPLPVPAPAVFAAPAPSVFAAPAVLPGPIPAAPALLGAPAVPAPAFLPGAPAPFAYAAGLPANYLWK